MANEAPTMTHVLAGGELLPSQLPTATTWSPEKKLAAAALAAGLTTIRTHYGDPAHAEAVAEDLAWVAASDHAHPFAFLVLCDLFDLDPAWVRKTVEGWKQMPPGRRALFSLHRHAA